MTKRILFVSEMSISYLQCDKPSSYSSIQIYIFKWKNKSQTLLGYTSWIYWRCRKYYIIIFIHSLYHFGYFTCLWIIKPNSIWIELGFGWILSLLQGHLIYITFAMFLSWYCLHYFAIFGFQKYNSRFKSKCTHSQRLYWIYFYAWSWTSLYLDFWPRSGFEPRLLDSSGISYCNIFSYFGLFLLFCCSCLY